MSCASWLHLPLTPSQATPPASRAQWWRATSRPVSTRSTSTLKRGSSFGLGGRFGSYSLGQFTQNVFTLPIDYTYTFSNYDKLIVHAPLAYMEVDGAEAYRGSLGAQLQKEHFPTPPADPFLRLRYHRIVGPGVAWSILFPAR